MPTNANGYNSRVTDEALEKRFRDTFRSQGGSELVDDLYAQGVIVPIVDFTAAASGQQLAQNLQTAFDFSTTAAVANNQTTTLVNTAGFWIVNSCSEGFSAGASASSTSIEIYDGTTAKTIWQWRSEGSAFNNDYTNGTVILTVFLRSGDSLRLVSSNNNCTLT